MMLAVCGVRAFEGVFGIVLEDTPDIADNVDVCGITVGILSGDNVRLCRTPNQ